MFYPVQFSVTSKEELNFGYSTANSWINQMWLESISNVIKALSIAETKKVEIYTFLLSNLQ
jgi:hypothetical protein